MNTALLAGTAVAALGLSACSSDTTSDISLPGAPEGFALTATGSSFDLGEPAYVATEARTGEADDEPTLLFWKMTAQGPVDKTIDEAGDSVEDTADVDHFVCMTYDLEFLGSQAELGPVGDTGSSFDPPQTTVIGDDDRLANMISMAPDSDACDLTDDLALPDYAEELAVGTTYKGAALSFVSKDEGVDPTGLEFTYAIESVPELDDHTATVTWNEGGLF